MSRKIKIALVAGEPSGDTLGAGLMFELKKQYPDVEFSGIGGEKMIAEGLQCRVPMERLSVMGITEVLGRLPELLKVRKEFFHWCVDWQPDAFVGIDAPDFNLNLEVKLREQGIKTVHYVSPSVWAWRKGRLKKIRKAVDHMLTLLPFEADFYVKEGIPVTHVGHTLADQLPISSDTGPIRDKLGISKGVKVVALLPGSRSSEVKRLAVLFLDSLVLAFEKIGPFEVVVPAANENRQKQIEALLESKKLPFPCKVLLKKADEAIAASDAVLVASGTATLQTMLWKKPMVVAYQMSAFSFWLMSTLATTRWVSLPNILEQRDWVPERLQKEATVVQLSEDMIQALSDEGYREDFIRLATEWHHKLALNADAQAAKAVLSLVN
jgi:lipid-A-disaccharide synthase